MSDTGNDNTGSAVEADQAREHDVSEAFKKDGVVPDVIDHPPTELIKITYGPDVSVKLGNILKTSDVKIAPSRINWKSDSNKFYVLIMIDPDAPGRRIHFLREVNHWLIVNIPGDEIEKGDVLANYVGSGPPPFSGLHRYIFLVYEQPGKLTFDEPIINGRQIFQRMRFTVRQFADKYKLGQPIAGNYFQARF